MLCRWQGLSSSAAGGKAVLGLAFTRSPRAIFRRMSPEPVSKLVLVVDDFVDNREMYSEYLSFCGFRVIQATNGREAVETARTQKPDIIVMDLSLPVMDGWEATRLLKADVGTRNIPVVVLTGHALPSHSRQAQAAGCDSFLTKPCLPDQLVVEIKRMLASGTLEISAKP